MSETSTEQVDASAATEPAPPEWKDAAAASAEANSPSPKTVKRLLNVRMSPAAKNALADDYVRASERVDALKDELAAYCKKARKQVAAAETAAKGLREAVKAGAQLISLDVIERRIEETGAIELIRADTGEIVDVVAMTADQRQLTLADAAKANGATPADDDDEGDDDADDDDLSGPEVDDESLGDIPPPAETRDCVGDDDDDDAEASGPAIDDPDAVLAAAAEAPPVEEETSADAPAPKRARGRRKS